MISTASKSRLLSSLVSVATAIKTRLLPSTLLEKPVGTWMGKGILFPFRLILKASIQMAL